MRPHAALLGLLLLAGSLPLQAGAQAEDPFLEDAPGDVMVASMLPGVQAEAVPRDSIDLLALDIIETDAEFTFVTTSASLPTQASTDFEGVYVTLGFLHNGRAFQLRVLLAQPAIEPNVLTWVSYRDNATDPWSLAAFSRAMTTADREAGTLTTPIPRDMLADASGTAPFRSRLLDGIHVTTTTRASSGTLVNTGTFTLDAPVDLRDRMPDGGATAAWQVLVGPEQSGHAVLRSDAPFRASNGEATTFVYNVTAENRGGATDRFRLEVASVPHGYTVNLPVQAVSVEPGAQTTFPVLVTMPFGHQHGSAASVLLEAHSESDPASVGRIELGVRFLQVPQPAGHHDTVYFHTHASTSIYAGPAGTFNTLEDDEADSEQEMPSSWSRSSIEGQATRTWPLQLNPSLAMGVHVDPSKIGNVHATFLAKMPMPAASFAARLCVGMFSECTPLATMPPTPAADLGANEQVAVEGPLVPVTPASRVPFTKGSTLWLELNITYTQPGIAITNLGPEQPVLLPGGSATLPLQDWHDAVTGSAVFGGPGLTALGSQERLANPGGSARFDIEVRNPLDHAATVELDLSGANVAWATLQDERIEVPAGGTAKTSVLVTVPEGTGDGDQADLVLQARTTLHPEALGLLRLVVEADTQATHPDDAAAQGGRKSSPGLGPAPLLAVLALAMAAGRWRRGGVLPP